MSTIQKLTEEEISQIKYVMETRNSISSNIGEIEVKLYELNKLKENYFNQLYELKIKELEISNSLTQKYGSGEINIDEGIIKVD